MDMIRLRSGELLTGAAAVALLAVSFAGWFSGASAWDAMTLTRIPLAATVLLGLALVALTVTARPVAIPVAAAVSTVVVAALTAVLLAYRVLLDAPGSDAAVDVEPAAYAGLALVVVVGLGAWRTLQDERTQTAASRRQTEAVLAVRGAPRPAPPSRDPSRPPRRS